MKLRSTVKTPQFPIMATSHRNSGIIDTQKAAGRQVRVEKSHSRNKLLGLIPDIKKSKISTVDKQDSKQISTQSGKKKQIKHSAAKKTAEVKRAGRGKTIQCKNIKLASGNVHLLDLDSISSPTVIENGRSKVVKAVRNIKQQPAVLNKMKPASTSLQFPGDVSRSNFSLFSDSNTYKIGNPLAKKGRSVASFVVERQSMKKPDLYSNVISVNSTSDFTTTTSRKQLFEETKAQVKSSNTIKTSFASFRFERTEKKERNNSKLPEHFHSVSQIVNYVAPKNNISSRKSLRPANTSESNKITANSFQNLKKLAVVKNYIAENKAPQPGTVSARNHTGYVLQNNQVRSKPDKREAKQKSRVNIAGATRIIGKKQTQQVNKAGATRMIGKKQTQRVSIAGATRIIGKKQTQQVNKAGATRMIGKKQTHRVNIAGATRMIGKRQTQRVNIAGATRMIGKKQTQMLAKKQKDSTGVVRNGRSMRSSRQKPPKSSKKHIPSTSVAKKRKNRIDAEEKKTIPVKVSEISINDHERSQYKATKTRPINELPSPLPLKSLQTGKKKQFASLTKITAKESGIRKNRRLTSRDYLPQNQSQHLAELYAPLLAVGLTPIRSLVKASPKSVSSSPTIIPSVYKATKQAKLPQSKEKTDLNQRRYLSFPRLASEDVLTDSYRSKFTSTPIQARPSLYETEKASSSTKTKSVTVQRQKESAVKHAKKNVRKRPNIARMKKYPKNKTVASISINSNNQETVTLRKNLDVTSATYSKSLFSMVSASSPNKSAKKNNAKKKNSLLSSVVNEASKPHHFTVEENLYKAASEVKARKLPLPVSPKTVTIKSSELHKRLHNNPINMPPRKKLRSSYHLKKDVKLSSSYKPKLVSRAVKRTEKQYQSRQTIKPKSKPGLHRTSNRPLESPKNILSLATKVVSSQKSHTFSGKSPQNEKQIKPPQKKRNSKASSSLSSLAKRKNNSLSNTSTGAKSSNDKASAKSFAASMSRVAKVTDIAILSGSRKGVQRVSANRKKTSRMSEGGKIIKPIPYARNVRGLSHRNVEDNLELINNAFLPQAKRAKKSLSLSLNRNPEDFSRKEKSLILPRKRGLLFPSKDIGEKPAPKRTGKREPLPAISVKNAAKNSVDTRHCLTGITPSIVEAADVQGKAVTPRQTETSKPLTLINKVIQTSSLSQKKISSQSKKKVTKVAGSKIVASEKIPKLSSKVGVKKSAGKRPGKVVKAKFMNWLALGQNNTLQLLPRRTKQEARYFATSDSLPAAKISLSNKHSQVPKLKKGRKSASVSQKTTRSAKTTESKKIDLVSAGKKKSRKPSTVGSQIQKIRSSTSPKKSGKKTLKKIADNQKNLTLSKQTKSRRVIISPAKLTKVSKNKEIKKKIGLVSLGQKKASEATSQDSFRIPRTKSSILSTKKDKKVLNKHKLSAKPLSEKISSDKVKRRKSILALVKITEDSKDLGIDNINFVLQGQNEEPESSSGYKMQQTKSSEQKKTHNRILRKQLSRSPQLLLTRVSAIYSPNISRITKVKQITKKSSEQAETPKLVPAKYETEAASKSSSSKKAMTKKRKKGGITSETYRSPSNKASPKITRANRTKSVSVSPKFTRNSRSKNVKTIVLATSRNEALKISPQENKTHKTKLSAVPKETKRTVKQIPSKIHSDKVNSNAYVNIDASKSSPTNRRDKKRTTKIRNSLVSQGQKGKSKHLTGRQKNKELIPTDVPKAHTRRVKSAEVASDVLFKKTEEVYTVNRSFNKSQPSRSISTVRPFNIISAYAGNERTPLAQHKGTRDTSITTSDIIYARQAQNISSSTRKTEQASPELHHIYHELGRRSLFSLDITDSNYSPQTNKISAERKVTVPLDKESPLPEVIRTESYAYNVSYTRNDTENRLPVKRAAKLQQALHKNVPFSEPNKKTSKSKVSFSSSVGSADDHTRYITNTPFPLRGKSAVSSMYIDSARDISSNMESVRISQPLVSCKHHVTTDSRSSAQGNSHLVSERDSNEESVADSSTKEGHSVGAEEASESISRKVEENKELQESRDNSDLYEEEIEKDNSKYTIHNSHSKQCIIS